MSVQVNIVNQSTTGAAVNLFAVNQTSGPKDVNGNLISKWYLNVTPINWNSSYVLGADVNFPIQAQDIIVFVIVEANGNVWYKGTFYLTGGFQQIFPGDMQLLSVNYPSTEAAVKRSPLISNAILLDSKALPNDVLNKVLRK